MSNDIKVLENGKTANVGSMEYLSQMISRPGEVRIADHLHKIPGICGHQVTTVLPNGSIRIETELG